MHLIWSSEVKCVVTVWFLWSFWYILSNGVGDVTNRWRHFWFTSQHQSDLKYITHNSGSHYCFYYRSHQHTRTRNKNIYIAIKDYPQIRVWSYLPQVVHSFWERPIYMYWVTSRVFHWGTLQQQQQFTFIFLLRFAGSSPKVGHWQPEASDAKPVFGLLPVPGKPEWQIPSRPRWKRTGACSTCFSTATSTTSSSPTRSTTTTTKDENSFQNYEEISITGKR